MPYGITQCYLPPGSSDILVFTPAEAGTRLSNPGSGSAHDCHSGLRASADVLRVPAFRRIWHGTLPTLVVAKISGLRHEVTAGVVEVSGDK